MVEMKGRLRQLLIVGFFLFFSSVYAQKTSVGSGDWNNAATWTPAGVPSSTEDVTITVGHTVVVPANAFCRRLYINGTLNMTGTFITMDISNNSVASPTNGIQLGAGSSFLIGASNTVYFSSTQASGIVNNGGTIVSTGTNGADGGTVRANTNSGGQFGISGTAVTTVYNLEFLANADFRIMSGGLYVNGTLSERDNNFTATNSTLSPVYGSASTLSINNNNQGISGGGPLNNALNKLWSVQTGTIGVTQGYPNNVVLANFGTSSGNVNPPNVNVGWRPGAIAIGLNGTLQIGNGGSGSNNTLIASLDQITSLNCGGIIVENGSTLVGPPTGATFVNRGNFSLQGATTGVFYSTGATINFAGNGTSGNPQTISTTGTAVTFTGVTVTNGTYVQLLDPVTVTNTLSMTSGIIGTSTTNPLVVSSTSASAISGGSATSYVNGPLSWSVSATTSANYVFPVGDYANGNAYLPLTLSPNSITGTVATVTAFNVGSGGSADNTITTISNTEYWSLSTVSAFSSGPLIDVARSIAVSPYNAMGVSSTANGVYTAIGGLPSGNSMTDAGPGTASPVFMVLVQAPLSVVKLGGTNVTCNGTTGSLLVGGSGGTAPYEYRVDGGAYQSSGTFSPLAPGDHQVTVRDATNATSTSILKVLGALVINGNSQDVTICGTSTTLVASNALNNTPTYSWSTSNTGTPVIGTDPAITVNPTVDTRYYVTSQLYNNNLLTNGSFESGATTGFTSSYNNWTGQAQYGTTPGNNGYYSVTNSGSTQCAYFTINNAAGGPTLPAQDGVQYFVGDGATFSSSVWTATVNGLTIGSVYKFQYYYAAGNPDATRAQLRTNINGADQGTVTANNPSAWTLATYNWTATTATATISITNLTATGNTNGNDFFLDNMQFLAPCTVTDSINVLIGSQPADAGNNSAICSSTNNATTLAATGTGTWTVQSGSGSFSNASSPTSGVSGLSLGANVFRWTVNGGCGTGFDDVTITVNATPAPDISGAISGCADADLVFSTTNNISNAYLWTFVTTGSGSGNSTSNTITVDIGDAGGKLIVAETAGSCTGKDSVEITITAPDVVIAVAGTDASACQPDINLAGNDPSPYTGTWTLISGGGTIVDVNDPVTGVTGVTAASVFEWTIDGTCASSSDQVTITPVSGIDLEVLMETQDDTLCDGSTKTLTADGSGGSGNYSYHWTELNGSFDRTTSGASTEVTPGEGVHVYLVSVSDDNLIGCESLPDTVTILGVSSQELAIPNLITPNGDEKNDYFEIKDEFQNAIYAGATLEITNRWGQSVFSHSNYDNSWNPASLSDGMYYFYLKSGCGEKEYKGWVQILK